MTAEHLPDGGAVQKAITFLYYRDLPAAVRFYEDVLGLTLAIDQGWSRIYRVSPDGYLGLVDERRGMNPASDQKPVQFCLRVADVEGWHRAMAAKGVDRLSEIFTSESLRIRAFVFHDPEGYQIEVQTALAPDA